MKKFFSIILMVAALVACTDMDQQDPIEEPAGPKTYTMTVKASKEVSTKALTLDETTSPHKLNVTWMEGEEVLVYQEGSQVGTLLSAASNTASTTLTGTLNSSFDGRKETVFYFHTANDPSYGGQDGTLFTIAANYDFCEPAIVTADNISVENNNVTISGGIPFGASKQAVAKFTLVDKENTNIKLSASKLTVTADIRASVKPYLSWFLSSEQYTLVTSSLPYENSLNIEPLTYQTNGEGVIYLAIPDKVPANATAAKDYIDFTLTATVGSDTYTYSREGFPFENGKYYEIVVKMQKQ